jgi:hypothetical protein
MPLNIIIFAFIFDIFNVPFLPGKNGKSAHVGCAMSALAGTPSTSNEVTIQRDALANTFAYFVYFRVLVEIFERRVTKGYRKETKLY